MILWRKEKAPRRAYNLWAGQYDLQPDNLMLAMDEELFSDLLRQVSLPGKAVADIGCGTGRHWGKMLLQQPVRLAGYDASEEMLKQLKQKYPDAETHLSRQRHLQHWEDRSCDVIVSTLAIAHIRQIESSFREWNRALKTGGDVLITDYHPDALAKGGDRTFRYAGKVIAVKNHIHSLEKIGRLASRLGWEVMSFAERKIDDRVRHYYEKQQALPVFERFRGTSFIYGLHLKKRDVPA